ncbi:hypothetical protein JCM6882_004923 [Rhodosporidiobolus microsporus]
MRTTLAATAVAAFALAAAPVLAQEDAAVSSSQFWHERYHGLLSMSAYSDDPTTVCAQTFDDAALASSFPDSTEAPWTYIQGFGPTPGGAQGYTVIIPEMDKVVIVFRGLFGWESTFNHSTTNIGTLLNLGENCANCTAHAAATQAYLEAREATNDWELVKYYVNTTGHQWSITGHGWGGMLAQIASIDLGWRGLCHWSHSHGAPRTFNPAAANLYNSLFGGEAGQRTVANNDVVPTYIPESDEYTHVLQGFHIIGNGTSNATYGYDFEVCNYATDPECTGGDDLTDHYEYYTPVGYCGKPYYGSNETVELAYLSSVSSAFYATATSTFVPPSVTSTPTAVSSLDDSASATDSAASTGSAAADAAASGSNASTTDGGNGAAGSLVSGVLALAGAAFGGALLLA